MDRDRMESDNENQLPVIPEITYEIMDGIRYMLATNASLSVISKSLNLPYEVIDKLMKDIINDVDPEWEKKKMILSYDHLILQVEHFNNVQNKELEGDEHSKGKNSSYETWATQEKFMKAKIDLLIKSEPKQELTYNKRKFYKPSTKQKEVLDILERLGEVDKKTIAKNMNPEVSEPRVYHLMHGKNGKPGLLDLVMGVSYRKNGNKNYYKMLYKMVED